MLKIRPANRMNWMGLAVSYHLLEQYDTAEKVLFAFEDSLKDVPDLDSVAYENSEMFMYKNLIIEESGDIRLRVLDKLAWKETKGKL